MSVAGIAIFPTQTLPLCLLQKLPQLNQFPADDTRVQNHPGNATARQAGRCITVWVSFADPTLWLGGGMPLTERLIMQVT